MKKNKSEFLKILVNFLNTEKQQDILELENINITVETVDNYPTDPPAFLISADNFNSPIQSSFWLDLEDFKKVCKFLKKIANKKYYKLRPL
jgi:hypothetical protein